MADSILARVAPVLFLILTFLKHFLYIHGVTIESVLAKFIDLVERENIL
jgi:hypothetical protein